METLGKLVMHSGIKTEDSNADKVEAADLAQSFQTRCQSGPIRVPGAETLIRGAGGSCCSCVKPPFGIAPFDTPCPSGAHFSRLAFFPLRLDWIAPFVEHQ